MIYFVAGVMVALAFAYIVDSYYFYKIEADLQDEVMFWRDQVLFPKKLKVVTPPIFKKSIEKKGKKK